MIQLLDTSGEFDIFKVVRHLNAAMQEQQRLAIEVVKFPMQRVGRTILYQGTVPRLPEGLTSWDAVAVYLAVCVDGTTLPMPDANHTAAISGVGLGFPYIDCINCDGTPLIPGPTRTVTGGYVPTIVVPAANTPEPWGGNVDGSPYDLLAYSAAAAYAGNNLDVRVRTGAAMTTAPAGLPMFYSASPYHPLDCTLAAYPFAAGDYENAKVTINYVGGHNLANQKVTVCRGVRDSAGAGADMAAYPYPHFVDVVNWASPAAHGWMEDPLHRYPVQVHVPTEGETPTLVDVDSTVGNNILYIPL